MNAAVIGLHRARDSDMRAIRRELHAERADARLRRIRNTLPPQPRPERLTPLLPLIPNAQALTLERLDAPEQLPHTQNRALTRAMRERRVSLPPRRPIIRVSVLVRRQLHIHHVRIIARQRSLTPHREHLARIGRARRSANHEHQPVRCRVRRRHHILHRLLRENLSLVKDQHINLRETTTEAGLARTKQDARPVLELDHLLAIRTTHSLNKRLHRRALSHARHRAKSLRVRARPMRRPKNQRPRRRHRQRETQRANRVRLPHLTRNRRHHATNARRIQAIGTLPQRAHNKPLLPRIERCLHPLQLCPHGRPRRRHDPLGENQVSR